MTEHFSHPERPRRQLPTITIVLMAIAFRFTLVLAFGDLPSPYIPGMGFLRLGGLLILIPIFLEFVGAVAAVCYRTIERDSRVGWAVLSGVSGFIEIWVLFTLDTLIGGP